jgi:hypothetical protein
MKPPAHSLSALALAIVGGACLLVSFLAFLFEITDWLRYASWEPIEIHDAFSHIGLPEPYFTGWLGAQKAWYFFRQAPVTLVFLAIGLALISTARVLLSYAYHAHWRQERRSHGLDKLYRR